MTKPFIVTMCVKYNFSSHFWELRMIVSDS